MSAFGGKADPIQVVPNIFLLANSEH
jgi:hypothetical protein